MVLSVINAAVGSRLSLKLTPQHPQLFSLYGTKQEKEVASLRHWTSITLLKPIQYRLSPIGA